jgi:hypothetical protein
MFEPKSFTIPFYGDLLNYAHGYIQTAVTVAAVTENVCMSRHWKAESVAYGSHKQHTKFQASYACQT